MDLAEIRKKANAEKADVAVGAAQRSNQNGPGHNGPSIQGAPAPAASSPPAVTPAAVPLAPAPEVDLLEALFAAPETVNLATEEAYLQGIAGDDHADEDLRQWLSFSLGKEEYALDISDINEIIKLREITDIPRVPDFILGIVSLRGVIVPVFDLKKRLKQGATTPTPASRIIVCQQGERSAGLLVDSITQVVRLPGHTLEPPPAVLAGLDRDLVEGVGRHQGRMIVLLHLNHVLDVDLI